METVRNFPPAVKDEIGFALYQAQTGNKHVNAKPLKGLGPGVLEIVSDHRGDTFRAVYTVRTATKVYVLHAFQKKSKRRIATPKSEVELIKQRLKRPFSCTWKRKIDMTKRDYTESSGNVFADLGTPRAEEALAKAELAQKIVDTIRARHLTQVQAAELLDVDQPKISSLTRGRLSGFSIDRLLRFLMLLGHDIEITVKSRSRSRARLLVA